MEKKIQDYLYLYPKVPIAICEPDIEPVGHYLEGFDWYLNKAIAERVNYDPSWIKPILRPLSDMTEDDAIELCKAYSPEAFGDYRFSKWEAIRDAKNFCYNVSNKHSDMSFAVDLEKMHIKVYEDDCDTYPGIENHTYFLEYLKRGFDVFGLIEAGLAIDKTQIKV